MHTGYDYHPITYYSSLLKKHFERKLSLSERRELARWLWECRENRSLYEQIRSAHTLKSYYIQWQQIDSDKEYELLLARCPLLQSRRRYWRVVSRRLAAVVVLILGVTLAYKYVCIPEYPEVQVVADEKVALLKTSDGKVFPLKYLSNGQIPGMQINDSLKELICEEVGTGDSLIIHELVIPRGGEYTLTLSDGTKVWLNSETELHFPVKFGPHEREISLRGEAYLEVAADTSRPFRVKSGLGKVEVLGTAFGIKTYPEEQKWSTVLVRGSVRVSYGQDHLLLEPGREAFLENGLLEQRECDTEKELAWVKGLFIFRHDPLKEVVTTLSRWYDVEFSFADEKLKDYLFTGQVSRDIGIEQILNLMERMNVVSFEKKGEHILIKEKAGRF